MGAYKPVLSSSRKKSPRALKLCHKKKRKRTGDVPGRSTFKILRSTSRRGGRGGRGKRKKEIEFGPPARGWVQVLIGTTLSGVEGRAGERGGGRENSDPGS